VRHGAIPARQKTLRPSSGSRRAHRPEEVIVPEKMRRGVLAAVVSLIVLGTSPGIAWAGGRTTKDISLVNISALSKSFANGLPKVAVSRVDPKLVGVAWRKYGLPI